MTNIEYLKNWIWKTSEMFGAAPFKYALYDDNFHIIKHPDYLDEQSNRLFLEHITDLIIDFHDKYSGEDIYIVPESDYCFGLKKFDLIYDGKAFLPDKSASFPEMKEAVYS